MDDDLQVLLEFLSRCQPEVLGRSTSAPASEEAVMLLRFASGRCSEEERLQVCQQLRLHPAWLRWLADRVREAKSAESRSSYAATRQAA